MEVSGENKPISVDLDGPLFADGAGANFVIGCLPLADGYATAFRNFDMQKQKVKLMQLQVAGSESVTVPAGTFDAFKVELSSADGGPDKSTLWIAKETRTPVKIHRDGRNGRRHADRRACCHSARAQDQVLRACRAATVREPGRHEAVLHRTVPF